MTSERRYRLELHRSERVPRLYDARLYRVTDDIGQKLVAPFLSTSCATVMTAELLSPEGEIGVRHDVGYGAQRCR